MHLSFKHIDLYTAWLVLHPNSKVYDKKFWEEKEEENGKCLCQTCFIATLKIPKPCAVLVPVSTLGKVQRTRQMAEGMQSGGCGGVPSTPYNWNRETIIRELLK